MQSPHASIVRFNPLQWPTAVQPRFEMALGAIHVKLNQITP